MIFSEFSLRHPYSIVIRMLLWSCIFAGLSLAGPVVWSMGIYQEPTDFIDKAFDGHSPQPKAIFLSGETKQTVKDILGHRYSKIRIRYWLNAGRSVWILEEIGKDRPITTGVTVKENKIEQIKILIFRETRGWEVRHDFFTEQFTGATLNPQFDLDQQIDGITGATLSVRAVTNLARLTLYLHGYVSDADA